MADAQVFQSYVNAGTQGGDVRVPQAYVLAGAQMPSEEARATQSYTSAGVQYGMDVRVTQSFVLVAVRGRIENRRVRAWTFSLDGHDFYVLRLGEDDTLVCDLKTGQWADWNSPDLDFWRVVHGLNWTTRGGQIEADFETQANIIAGDDTFGILWLLDPTQGYDEAPRDAAETPFERKATGGIAMRMRQTARCNEVYALANKGAFDITSVDPTISLRTSDDAERTWIEQGAITVVASEWDQEFAWRSLGLIQSPGRIFEISDNCLARLDGLDFR